MELVDNMIMRYEESIFHFVLGGFDTKGTKDNIIYLHSEAGHLLLYG